MGRAGDGPPRRRVPPSRSPQESVMDPMFDLAGPLLRKLYPDWVSLATIERVPSSLPARRLRNALRQGIGASDPVPPHPQPDDETRCRVALADAVPPREWESL